MQGNEVLLTPFLPKDVGRCQIKKQSRILPWLIVIVKIAQDFLHYTLGRREGMWLWSELAGTEDGSFCKPFNSWISHSRDSTHQKAAGSMGRCSLLWKLSKMPRRKRWHLDRGHFKPHRFPLPLLEMLWERLTGADGGGLRVNLCWLTRLCSNCHAQLESIQEPN